MNPTDLENDLMEQIIKLISENLRDSDLTASEYFELALSLAMRMLASAFSACDTPPEEFHKYMVDNQGVMMKYYIEHLELVRRVRKMMKEKE